MELNELYVSPFQPVVRERLVVREAVSSGQRRYFRYAAKLIYKLSISVKLKIIDNIQYASSTLALIVNIACGYTVSCLL